MEHADSCGGSGDRRMEVLRARFLYVLMAQAREHGAAPLTYIFWLSYNRGMAAGNPAPFAGRDLSRF